MIPKIFHFIYGLKPRPQRLHLIHYVCIRSCIAINKPDKIFFYYEQEPIGRYWQRIKSEVVPIEVAPLKMLHGKKLGYAHQADFIRVEMLNKYGGVYADLDTIFVNEMPKDLYGCEFVMGREDPSDPYAGLGNALIMASKNSHFGKLWEENIHKEFDGSWNNHSIRYPLRLSKEFPESIHIEPQRSFYKHSWTKDGLHNIYVNVDNDLNGVYSMHLWEHLSWEYINRINEEYVKNIDSTYTLLARPYLDQ